jgi:hypothetical protein
MACFLKSNRVMQEIIANSNHGFFKVKSRFGLERKFLKSNRIMRKIISKPNHVRFF